MIIKNNYIFFNDTATTEIYTLSLHDALPIFALPALPEPSTQMFGEEGRDVGNARPPGRDSQLRDEDRKSTRLNSSHRQYLVCRLLLEKKNIYMKTISQRQ